MKIKRIISSLLAVLMLMSAFALVTSADEVQYEYNTTNAKPTIDYLTGQGVKESVDTKGNVKYEADGVRTVFTKEDKLATMDFRFAKDGYELYVDEYSGEVAARCVATGEILFSNPYNIADSKAEASVKKELMSQLSVKFTDVSTGDETTFYSYEQASERGQIVVRNTKNGIRVEYTIGREEARMLVPRVIQKKSFEDKIESKIKEAVGEKSFAYGKFMAYYTLKDPEKAGSNSLKEAMYKAFPITKKMAVYVIESTTSQTELASLEQTIKTYCPDYTYEELDEDHMLTEYESEDKNPPLFKMALEYSLDANGMIVRLPANGIRFNEALYQLYSVEILPYMGAGAHSNDAKKVFKNNAGYTFFPDGSGTLFDFEKITNIGTSTTVTGKVYGADYAYHTITSTHQEPIRYPVFGIVSTEDTALIQYMKEQAQNPTAEGETAPPEPTPTPQSSGFVAIVEEGDALMELTTYHAVKTSEYNTIKMAVYPRPQDTYNVADAISVGQNDTWTVVSSRKYTGNYKIRYIMLTDPDVAESVGVSEYYNCNYTGMAKAYREYLESTGVLTRLTADDVEDDVPVYIETFGALETTQRILSIPVEVMTPLTTFEDITTMYDDLSEKDITNIKFIMTGYTKGGISARQVPYNLKWNSAVDDEIDFDELLTDARDNGYGVYPDFDFAYSQSNTMFDGLTLKDHGVKTIDDRYTSRREYSATRQTHVSFFDIAISPAYYSHFYEKLTEKYTKYSPMGISVSTLGSALNSDFDEDEPYNREDSKEFTVKAFEYFDDSYDKVLTAGGNAYTWKYVDYITDIALDSSRYSQSSAAVPFLGMVLHGYVEFAGSAVNMEGNIDYALLKAIENGASLKFILSYRNTNYLKDSEDLSSYYSIRYNIWFDDVVALYSEINDVLKGVQTSVITKHEFVDGVRVPDDDELSNDAKNTIDAAIEANNAYEDKIAQAEKDKYREAREQIALIIEEINTAFSATGDYTKLQNAYNDSLAKINAPDTEEGSLKKAIKDAADALALLSSTDAEYTATENALRDACTNYATELTSLGKAATAMLNRACELSEKIGLVKGEYLTRITNDPTMTAAQKADITAAATTLNADLVAAGNDIEAKITAITAQVAAAYTTVSDRIDDFEGDGNYFAVGALTAAIPAAYVYEPVEEEPEAPIEKPEEPKAPVYSSDDSKIVYEVYENGTAFLLNFNNYTVMVNIEVDGVMRTYTIDAYGYIVLKAAA